MARRVLFIVGAVVLGLGISISAQNSGEQALINDLAIANRILSSDELGVLRVYGHASARSQRNPNRFYIARNVAPAFVTARDIIENDLDGNAVSGIRRDQHEERFVDAAIYKSRPDVMAVVHMHSPELIAFSINSVPLPSGGGATAVYDIRKFNNGRIGEITTPALGQSLAQALGARNAILLLGHGAVAVSSSVPGSISAANSLRRGAVLQMQMIAMGGAINPNPREYPGGRVQAPAPPAAPASAPGGGTGGLDTRNSAGDRAWDHWRRIGARMIDSNPVRNMPQPADPVEAIKRDLAIASRILSSSQLGIMDTAGHVSVRHPSNPNRYFISRAIAPAGVTPGDLIEYDLDSRPVAAPREDGYIEVHIHGQIYKARPDVMAVIHAHTPELVAFGQTSVKLRPVFNGGAFIGDGIPLWAIGRFDPTQSIVTTPELGRSLAEAVGKRAGALLTGHGIALTDSSLYGLVNRVYDFRLNAMIQQQAILLGGNITYLEGQDSDTPPPPVVPDNSGGGPGAARFWEYWKRQFTIQQ